MKMMLAVLLVLFFALPLKPASASSLKLLDSSSVKDRFASNPRSVRDIGDPMVIREDDGYHVFATGGPIGFNTWASKDLVSFEKSKALKKLDWASGDYWAPEVYHAGDRYVMLYTARWKENGSLRTGIAFSDAVTGPYEDPLGHPLMDLGYATIDATLTWDDEGVPYMIYVRDCSENRVGEKQESHIYGVRMTPDLLALDGEPVLLLKPEGEWETRSGDTRWNEGPAVVRHDGKYYLFYSVNGYWMKEYSVCAAVSDSPLGPYVKQANNPILMHVEDESGVLISGPGHNFYFTAGNELFTSYHTHTYPLAPSGNRQLCIDRAGFHKDGTAYICGQTLAPQLRPLKDLGLVNLTKGMVCGQDPEGLLTDGDTCAAKNSERWIFEGDRAEFVWDEPVRADMLLIFPAPGESFTATVTFNGDTALEVIWEGSGLPGSSSYLAFKPMDVTSMTVSFEGTARIGEIMLVGPDQESP